MIKELQTERKIEIIKDYYVRTMVSSSESFAILNKRRVFNGTVKHFTKIYEKDAVNTHETKELYYNLNEDTELPLNTFRLMAADKRGKQLILDGLLELLLLISDGKVYNVELNPLNFVAEDKPNLNKVYVKAFHREDRGLREITDKWLNDAKKVIGYFLLSDSGFNETNFNSLRPIDYHKEMTGTIAEQYMRIMKSTSIDQMARDWFTDTTYKEIKNFPPIVDDYKKPKDITTVGTSSLGNLATGEARYDDRDMPVNKSEDAFWEGHGGSLNPTMEDNEVENKLREKPQPKKKSNVKLVGVVVGVLIVGIVLWALLGQRSTHETIEVSDNYYKGAIKVATEKYNGAVEDFDLLVKEEMDVLTGEEKEVIFRAYLEVGDFDKALGINKDSAELIVDHLLELGQLEKVQTIEVENNIIDYEKAVVTNDYTQIIEKRTDVELTPRRHNQVIQAHVMLGEVNAAVGYVLTNELGNIGDQVLEYYNTYKLNVEVDEEANAKALDQISKIIEVEVEEEEEVEETETEVESEE